jgi:hypothetical protein
MPLRGEKQGMTGVCMPAEDMSHCVPVARLGRTFKDLDVLGLWTCNSVCQRTKSVPNKVSVIAFPV